MEIWTIIEEDHRRIQAILKEIKDGSGDRDLLVRRLKTEFATHCEGEEKAIYPVLHEIGGFAEPIEHAREEHSKVREMLRELDGAAGEGWVALFEHIEVAIQSHIDDEEWKAFPLAKKELPYHVAEHMKHEFEAAKKAALES